MSVIRLITHVSQLTLMETGNPTLILQAVGIWVKNLSCTPPMFFTPFFKHLQISFLSLTLFTLPANWVSPVQQAGAGLASLPVAKLRHGAAFMVTVPQGIVASVIWVAKKRRKRRRVIEKKRLFIILLNFWWVKNEDECSVSWGGGKWDGGIGYI